MWHGKFPYLSLVAPPLVTHREIFFPTRGFATRWGKIHTTFLLSGGMRHNLHSGQKNLTNLTWYFNAIILGFSISTIIERIPTLCSGAECQSVDCASQTLAKAPEATPTPQRSSRFHR